MYIGFIWAVRAVFVVDALALLAIPVLAATTGSDLAGQGMAMAYALFALVIGGGVLGALAFAWWRAEATWALVTVAVLLAAFTFVAGVLLTS